ncbi:MAG: TonB-dependent receptor [Cyclobacteriaceae bacterium]|nr:TonB-dependent receptor [Cyclobacteriaceae bacterium]
MGRGILFTFILLILHFVSQAQKIRVIDEKSGEGIEDVMIYDMNFNHGLPTDAKGVADISVFNKEDILHFQHPAYHDKILPLQDIGDEDNIIVLQEKIISINEVIISASKWEQDPEIIPNTIMTVKAREIEFKNPPTSADLLQESGQVFLQKSQLGGGSPMIRGFSANSVLLVIDGVRMNNAIYRSGNLQNVINIDVNAVQEAEVLFGPGSVMYGSDALGGVMDFHIKDPELSNSEQTRFRGGALLRYSNAAHERTGHFDLSIGGRQLGSYTSLSYTGFDDLRTGSGRTPEFPDYGKRTEYVTRIQGRDTIVQNPDENIQKFSGYDQYSLIQKFTFRPASHIDLNYGFYFSNTGDIPRYDRLIQYNSDSLPENAEWYYGPQKWMMNRLQTKIYRSNRAYNEARITLSHQWVEESRHDRDFQGGLLRSRTENVNVYNVNADFDKSFNDRHQFYYGFDGSFNKVNSSAIGQYIETGESTAVSTRYPDGGSRYYYAALYGNYQWMLNKALHLSAGIRYTHTGLKAELEDKSDLGFSFDEFSGRNGALNGSLGFVYHIFQRTKLDLALSSGFRAPNLDDMGKLFDSEPGYVVVPNKDLSPEYTYNAEMGITQNIGKNIRLHAVGFYTWLKDAMVRRDFTFNGMDSLVYDGEQRKVQALVNTGKANIYGFSVVLKGDITPNWGIFSSYTWTDGVDRMDQAPLRHTPPAFGKVAIYYKNKGLLAESNVTFSDAKNFEDLAPSEQNKAYLYTDDGALSWYTLNFRLKYDFSPAFSIHAGVENIFDKHYRTYSSGISAPGRNFIVALRLNL